MKSINEQNVINTQPNEATAMTTPTHNEPLTDLLAKWCQAKADEAAANKARVAIEAQILPFLEARDEGSVTTESDGWKVTATYKLTRTLSAKGFEVIRKSIPENLRPVKLKEVLDNQGIKYLADNEPEIYGLIAPHLTVKPAKTAINVRPPLTPAQQAEVA